MNEMSILYWIDLHKQKLYNVRKSTTRKKKWAKVSLSDNFYLQLQKCNKTCLANFCPTKVSTYSCPPDQE